MLHFCMKVLLFISLGSALRLSNNFDNENTFDSEIKQSQDIILSASKASGFKGFPDDCPVAFDIGTNNGDDAKFLLEQGYCVVTVDANPQMHDWAKSRLRKYPKEKIHFVTMGIDEKVGNLTFYVTKDFTRSSFEKAKAEQYGERDVIHKWKIPAIRCEALWSLVNRPPEFLRIDIEERHYVCVEALQQLKHKDLPSYISWEMHEFARNLSFPELDTQLIRKMQNLGYTKMKIVSNINQDLKGPVINRGGGTSGDKLPEQTTDVTTHGTEWVDTSTKLSQGIPCARCQHKDWWDYHMKLEK